MSIARVKCKCDHAFQDKQYGEKIRIANSTLKSPDKDTIEVRCTVCKTVHRVNKGQLK